MNIKKIKKNVAFLVGKLFPDETSESFLKRKRYLVLAFFVPFVLMGISFATHGVFPFGSRQIMVVDLWHQYYPFLVDLQNKLQNGGSLLYSWNEGLGTNFIALMSYYLASPLNFLTVFFPAKYLREILALFVIIKIGCAGLFSAMFFRTIFKKNGISIVIFSTLYALCAFFMGYYWNVIWMDSVAFLPLIALGTVALLRDKKFKVFVISLTLSIMANYYIGLFNCVFVIFCFFAVTVHDFGTIKIIEHFKRLLRLAVFSLYSVAMTAIITLPAYFALTLTSNSKEIIMPTAKFRHTIPTILSNLLAFIPPTAKTGLPNIYCGVIALIFVFAFFVFKKIKIREKIFFFALVSFFIASLYLFKLDFIWHGFRVPNQIPHRYAYLLSFVLVVMAFRAYSIIEESKIFHILCTALGLGIFMLVPISIPANETEQAILNPIFDKLIPLILPFVICLLVIGNCILLNKLLFKKTVISRILFLCLFLALFTGLLTAVIITKQQIDIQKLAEAQRPVANRLLAIIGSSLIIVTVISLLLVFSRKLINKQILSYVVFVIVVVEMAINTQIGVTAVRVTDRKGYPSMQEDIHAMLEKVEEKERGNIDFYRVELATNYSTNDPILYGYNGISQFSSMTKVNITNLCNRLGIMAYESGNQYYYLETMPMVNAFFGLKYIVARSDEVRDTVHNTQIAQQGKAKLYENNYVLPIGFMTESSITSVNNNEKNRFNYQNDIFSKATGIKESLFTQIELENQSHNNLTLKQTEPGNYSISPVDKNNSGTLNFSYKMPKDGLFFIYFSVTPGYGAREGNTVTIKGPDENNAGLKSPRMMLHCGGYYKKDDIITVSSTMTVENTNRGANGKAAVYAAVFNEEVFQSGFEKLNSDPFVTTSFSETKLKGTVDAQKDGILFTSISYEKGWNVRVDGKKVEPVEICGALMGIPIEEGHHEIELSYSPEGFIPGLLMTLAAILIFVGLCLLESKRKKKQLLEGTFEALDEESGEEDGSESTDASSDEVSESSGEDDKKSGEDSIDEASESSEKETGKKSQDNSVKKSIGESLD